MSDRPECVTCGFPVFRPAGHAAWCARVAAANRALADTFGRHDVPAYAELLAADG